MEVGDLVIIAPDYLGANLPRIIDAEGLSFGYTRDAEFDVNVQWTIVSIRGSRAERNRRFIADLMALGIGPNNISGFISVPYSQINPV